MNVSVVITCWNGRKLLEKNLPSVIRASKYSSNKIKEVIVVDDASSDDSVNYLKKNFPGVGIVVQPKNFGYSATCNRGIKEARGELVAILNLDVVPSENFLEAALPHFRDDKIFAVSFNEGKFGPGKLEWKDGFLQIKATELTNKPSLSDWASGGTSIFRKDVWEKLGGMDELFLPFYFEDIDLGIRARGQGYQCLWEPRAKVTHEHEATINLESLNKPSNFISNIKERNHLLLTWKNIIGVGMLLSHLRYLLKRFSTHPGYFRIIVLAIRRKATK